MCFTFGQMHSTILILIIAVSLYVVRSFWRSIQAKRAIRTALMTGSNTLCEIKRASMFTDHESIRLAFFYSLTIQDYYATCILRDGTKDVVNARAIFLFFDRKVTLHKIARCRTSRIMQPLEAAVFATILCKMNPNPERAFPTRF